MDVSVHPEILQRTCRTLRIPLQILRVSVEGCRTGSQWQLGRALKSQVSNCISIVVAGRPRAIGNLLQTCPLISKWENNAICSSIFCKDQTSMVNTVWRIQQINSLKAVIVLLSLHFSKVHEHQLIFICIMLLEQCLAHSNCKMCFQNFKNIICTNIRVGEKQNSCRL